MNPRSQVCVGTLVRIHTQITSNDDVRRLVRTHTKLPSSNYDARTKVPDDDGQLLRDDDL